ncbi:MAG: DUF6775 family putative metallopeptidase, partial [Thermoplasmata archaeon]
CLYSSENPQGSDLRKVKLYLQKLFPSLEVRVLPSIFRNVKKAELRSVATKLASARVKNPDAEEQGHEPLFGEVDYEIRAIQGRARVGGVIYEGRRLQELLMGLLPSRQTLSVASVVFTDRLISTFSRDDMRHHLRTIVCGFPSIVSKPGVVEAPAKPREFYILKRKMELEGASDYGIERLKSSFKGRFVDYGDPRLAEVLRGLALQAIMYHLALDPFCRDRDCRLFNSHRQEELVRAQITSGRVCLKHAEMLKELGKKPVLRW